MKKINNNAFTLVELLAVIVILGMLFLLSYPAVSKYINQTKETTYETYEKNMSSATANLMTDCLTKNTSDCLPSSKTSKKITLRTLVSSGYSKQLKDPDKDGEYCNVDKSFVVVSTKSSNVADLDYKVCLVCSNYKSGYCDEYTEVGGVCEPEDDKENPTCSGVIGESTTWINKPRTINVGCEDDCGCTQDSYSKTFSESTTTGEIEVKDIAGKKDTCTVSVYVDVDKPTCELQVSGDLNSSGWYTGSTAPVVSFKSKNDALSGVITYGLGTSKSSYDFNKDTSYTVKNGITTVYGYVQDKAGNVGTCSVQVKWDNLKPVVKDPEYGYQVYPKEDMASKSGSTISVNNYTSEYGSIHGVYVYMKSGSSGAEVTIKNGSTVLVTKTIDRGVTSIKIPFTKGTYNNLSFTFKNSTQLNYVDKIQVITNGTTGFYTNKDVTLYITGLDSLSGKGQYSFDNGSTWQDSSSKTYSTNNTNIKIKLKDTAGNISDVKSVSINNIDKTVPTCTLNVKSGTLGNNNWYTSNVTIGFNTHSDNASVRDYSFNSNGLGTPKEFTITSDGSNNSVTGHIIDKAGNTNSCSIVIKKDSTKPTCTVTPTGTVGNNSWYTSNVSISLTTSDATSLVNTYDLTESTTASYNKNTSKTLTSDTSSKTYYGYVKDNAGNTNDCRVTVKKDSTSPTCGTPTGTSTSYRKNIPTISVPCSDSTSECTQSNFSNSSWSATISTGTITISDKAGNTSNCTVNVYYDDCKKTTSSCGDCVANSGASCSATCGSGTIACTKSCSTTSSVTGSSVVCSTYSESSTKSCTGNNCGPSTAGGCPSWDDLFGDAACSAARTCANTKFPDKNAWYGDWHTDLPTYTCYANGGKCSITKGYDVKCGNETNCGSWYGYTVPQVNAAFKNRGDSCHYTQTHWCQCTYG